MPTDDSNDLKESIKAMMVENLMLKITKEEIANHPTRVFMQAWKAHCATEQEFYQMFDVFRLKNGIANVWTFETNFAPKEDIVL